MLWENLIFHWGKYCPKGLERMERIWEPQSRLLLTPGRLLETINRKHRVYTTLHFIPDYQWESECTCLPKSQWRLYGRWSSRFRISTLSSHMKEKNPKNQCLKTARLSRLKSASGLVMKSWLSLLFSIHFKFWHICDFSSANNYIWNWGARSSCLM